MKKKFDMLNELVLETKENYYMDKALDEIKICLEDIDAAYIQYSNNTPVNPNAIAQESMRFANMSPEQCRNATRDPNAVRSNMPATSRGIDIDKFEDPDELLNFIKRSFKMVMPLPAARAVVGYVKLAFCSAFGDRQAAMKDAGGLLGPLKANGIPWIILTYAIVSASIACYKILRKWNKKRKQRKLPAIQQEAYEIIDKHMDLICESIINKHTKLNEEFLNKGFVTMTNLGIELAKSQAPVLNEGFGDSIINIVNSFSLSILQSGVYCLAKLKGLLAITPQTNN